jgi:SMC interacting uncharacterized protein involved in chromosome segregation
MVEKGSDPIALWQQMIGEMEKGFSAFANQALSPQLERGMNQAGTVPASAQKQIGDVMEKYLVNMNLPSRAQMAGIAKRLQNIEVQLAELKVILQQVNAVAPQVGVVTAPQRSRRRPAGEPK